MNSLVQILNQLKTLLMNLLTRFEESPTFEKWVLSYESLETKSQKRVWSLVSLGISLLTLTLLLAPVGYVIYLRKNLEKTQNLALEISSQQTGPRVERRPAPPPTGWQSFPVTSASDLELVLSQFLAGQGVSPNNSVINVKGNSFSFSATEITLRQALNFTFQIDGWHPAISVKKFKLNTNRSSKDLVDLKMDFNLDGSLLNRFAAGGMMLPSPEADFDSGEGMEAFNGGGDGRVFPPAPPVSSGGDSGNSFQPPPSNFEDSFNSNGDGGPSDIPPPPLPLEPLEEEF